MFALKGKLVTPSEIITDGVIVIDGGKIVYVGAGLAPARRVRTVVARLHDGRPQGPPLQQQLDEIIDCGGNFICPGFIDLHVQGAGGADALDGTYEAINTVAKTLARNGTTAFLATTVVKVKSVPSPRVSGERVSAAVSDAMRRGTDGAQVLGIHLEGPFVNPAKRGMIKKENIKNQKSKIKIEKIIDACGGALKMMTIAPELPGAVDIIKQLKRNKIVASIGHTNATYDEAIKGFDAGITHATHIFNAMSGLHHRQPGAAGAILADERVSVQLIADGKHLHPAVCNLVVRQKGFDKVALITDSMSAAGLSDGKYIYNGLKYETKDGLAVYCGTGTFIGTALTLNKIVKRIVALGAADLRQAVEMASLTPAKVLGIDDKKGSLEPGKDADVVVMDGECNVKMTIVGGRILNSKSEYRNPKQFSNV